MDPAMMWNVHARCRYCRVDNTLRNREDRNWRDKCGFPFKFDAERKSQPDPSNIPLVETGIQMLLALRYSQ